MIKLTYILEDGANKLKLSSAVKKTCETLFERDVEAEDIKEYSIICDYWDKIDFKKIKEEVGKDIADAYLTVIDTVEGRKIFVRIKDCFEPNGSTANYIHICDVNEMVL